MNRIGDFGFLVAMFVVYEYTGSLAFVEVFDRAPSVFVIGGATITLTTLALFLGCTGKSAQIPLYTWLPDAMAGPTPVSALIHAATMVTGGVYLIARANVLFAMAPVSSAVVAGVGALTALFAATIALKQWDIKKVLAYSHCVAIGVHVRRCRGWGIHSGHLPSRHARFLQGVALPWSRQRNPRTARSLPFHAPS